MVGCSRNLAVGVRREEPRVVGFERVGCRLESLPVMPGGEPVARGRAPRKRRGIIWMRVTALIDRIGMAQGRADVEATSCQPAACRARSGAARKNPPPQVKAYVSCALLMVRIEPIADADPAACRASRQSGQRDDDRMPMMPHTNRTSIRAKPVRVPNAHDIGSAAEVQRLCRR